MRWTTIAVPVLCALPWAQAASQDENEAGRSYLIPALEIVAFDGLLNLFDRLVLGDPYHSSLTSIRRNLRRRWVTENDPFEINQFGHPYQGAMYHGFSRASGLNFWTSLGYTFAGSALWEVAGETTPPSWNDQIASGIAGAFLGEALFRIGNLILETGPPQPRRGRQLVTAAVSQPLVFNRGAFGDRFDRIVSSRNAAYYRRIQVGGSGATRTQGGEGAQLYPAEAVVDLSMEFGLPGQDEYKYTRPFDYFSLQATVTSGSLLESVLLRGLLAGTGYERGGVRGVWGLYGNYDYIAPQLFRVSSTALSLGTTVELRASDRLVVQGTAMAGAGYAAVGTRVRRDTTDYHYGLAPQAMLATRLILGDRAAVDLSAREYYVSEVGGTAGHDNILRFEASASWRLHEQRAVSLRYLLTRRDAFFPDAGGDRMQLRGTLGAFLTLLGHDRFGAVR